MNELLKGLREIYGRSLVLAIAASLSLAAVSHAQDESPDQSDYFVSKELRAVPALFGYCPAAYLLEGKATVGKSEFQVRHHGRVYYLSSEKARSLFLGNPEKFLPQFDGLNATALGGSYGNRFAANPEAFLIVDNKVYLFSGARGIRAFQKDPDRYIQMGSARFAEPGLGGRCPVTYHEAGVALMGNSDYSAVYGGWTYHFLSEEKKKQFLEDPERFLPRFRGTCVTMLAEGMMVTGNPEFFLLNEGRLYLFQDSPQRIRFMKNPHGILTDAEKQWKKLREEEEARLRR